MLLDSMKETRGWLESDDEVEVAPDRRAHLARKGQVLYGKFCGTDGRGICAESFAEYHLWLGEIVVVQDFLEFLDHQRLILSQLDLAEPDIRRRLAMTLDLIERVEAHLGEKIVVIQ